MRIASVSDIKAKVSAFLQESEEGPIVVTRNGKPVAILLGIQDEDEIERLLLSYTPRLRKILDRARRQIQRGESLDHDAFWTEADSSGQNRGRRSAGGKK